MTSGTLTFLFTDVEGSTRLVAEVGDSAYRAILDTEAQVFAAAVAAEAGRVFGSEGDAHFAVFDSPAAAVRAAAAAQRALEEHGWPDGRTIRVRMGIHTGEAQIVGGDFLGLEVHRVARIASAASGGQVLVSDATRALSEGSVGDLAFRDLGDHRLKDLARPERLLQLVGPGLADTFPPVRSLDATPNNLPPQLTSFVGRGEVLAAGRLLDGTRLLTLTGPGGTGKTRLSLELAAERVDRHPGGVWFVPLAAVTDAALVASAIAAAIGLVAGGRPPLDRLLEHLGDRDALLILDNMEQVLGGAETVGAILRGAPRTRIVVSSRAPLRITGEQEFAVPPLGLPAPADDGDPERLMASEAARLFVERAMAVRHDFAVSAANAPAIAAIVRRLDGLPLAIELAAARVRILTPSAIAERLADRLGLLTGGARDLPERQRTLRGAIDWSHDLLDEPQRRLFARLGVFAGATTLETIARVCGPADELGIDPVDGSERLAEQSLLRITADEHDDVRTMMLETIREYARERLVASGELDLLQGRHAAAYLEVARTAFDGLSGADRRLWLDRFEEDHDDLRAAIAWHVGHGDRRGAAALIGVVWRFWQARGHVDEGRRRAQEVLDLTGWTTADDRARFVALEVAGGLAYWAADFGAAHAHYREQVAVARRLDDDALLAAALYNASFVPTPTADIAQWAALISEPSLTTADEALDIYRRLGDEHGVARVLWTLGERAMGRRDWATSETSTSEALAIFERLGDDFGAAWALFTRGIARFVAGDWNGAIGDLIASLERFRVADDVSGLALVSVGLASALARAGRLEDAHRLAAISERAVGESGTRLAAQVPDAWFVEVHREDEDPVLAAAWDAGAGLSGAAAFDAALEIARRVAREDVRSSPERGGLP